MSRYWTANHPGRPRRSSLSGRRIYYMRPERQAAGSSAIAESDAPITIPLAFIPFKVDGRELGTLSRLQILRSSPKQVEAVNFRVKLADSIGDEQLSQCILVAGDNGMNFQVKHINPNATFYCATAKDTAGKNLAPLGSIETQRGNTYVLLSGADALKNFDGDMHGSNDAAADSISAVYERMADSIQQAAESIGNAAEQRADSFRTAAESARRLHSRRGRAAGATRCAPGGHAHAAADPSPHPNPSKPKVRVKVN